MKKAILILLVLFLAGCATHARIKMPTVNPVNDVAFNDKSLSYEILYSQPEPGLFMAGGEQMPLQPLDEAKLSVASASTLSNLPEYIFEQLPANVTRAEPGQGDYKLVVKLVAHDKKGPVYGDMEFAKSFAKSMLTLGFGADEYAIVADFDVTYALRRDGTLAFKKSYDVHDQAAHERGSFDFKSNISEYASQLLEKHLILTLNNFFGQAADKIDTANSAL